MKNKCAEDTETCANCGAKNIERVILESHKYDGLGIPIMLCRAVIRTTCAACNRHSHTIPHLGELSAAAAIATVLQPWKLTGKKIKFLRKALNLKANQLAERLRFAAETVSRLERGHIAISEPMDWKLRMYVIDALKAKAPGVEINVSTLAKIANGHRLENPDENKPLWFLLVKRATDAPFIWDRDVNHGQEMRSATG